MDTSEKDAARSKWRLTQRHKRGRGGAGGGARGGGRARGDGPDLRLGSNQERYEKEDEGGTLGDGPSRRSQGADLAELLSQAGTYDSAFYARQRVALVEEGGLPPADAGSYQGLSFDLKGLEACLAALPLHQVLRLSAPVDEAQQDTAVSSTGVGDATLGNHALSMDGELHGAADGPAQLEAGTSGGGGLGGGGGGACSGGAEDDSDIDLLLALGVGSSAPTAAGAESIAGAGGSLEDWLDNL